MSDIPHFRFILNDRSSTIIDGPVQGAGGMVRDLAVLHRCWDRARAGKPLGRVYESSRGHVKVYPEFSARGNGREVFVDLRKVVRIEPCGFTRCRDDAGDEEAARRRRDARGRD